MLNNRDLRRALVRSAEWFENSGVMLPSDGTWGVGERVLLLKGNSAAEQAMESFPAWTKHGDWCVLESRRADCNFETAFMYLSMWEATGESRYYETAHNLLKFLYFRSGLLQRDSELGGLWQWSHIKFCNGIWFDDNSWCCYLALRIARKYPEFDAQFDMTKWALEGAAKFAPGMKRHLEGDVDNKLEKRIWEWSGRIREPHFGALMLMALAEALPDESAELIDSYEKFMMEQADSLTVSEWCYALIGTAAVEARMPSPEHTAAVEFFIRKILSKLSDDGALPSEHHEAPKGTDFIDTIYTENWAAVAFQMAAQRHPECREPLERIISLLLSIQHPGPAPHVAGCWQGMYDKTIGNWGGGDCYEGGANSIYSGWTNAPISIVIARQLDNGSILD